LPDLHFTPDTATDAEVAAIEASLGDSVERSMLLPALRSVQERVGWIAPGAVNEIGRRLGVAPAEVYGVATVYHLLATQERPRRVVHACDDIACTANGAAALRERLELAGEHCRSSPCLGQCDRAPATLTIDAGSALHVFEDDRTPHVGGRDLRLLARVNAVDPLSLDEYRAHDGYLGLRRAFEIGQDATIAEVTASKLVGRGGAAFPTGKKMEAVARATVRPRYLICNADESEPGTFKDRVLMEWDPFAIVEAMTISAFATGCERGYVYVRGEYPLAARRLEHAIAQARAHGLLGDDVMERGVRFDVEVRRGAGAYICGEETALFNSLEGKRGEPRNKPPYPAQAGLFGKPTLVNNVETLACLPLILRDGGEAFAGIGTPQSTGPKLFCVSGTVTLPGLYEVPFGATLRELIELAGGVRDGRPLRAVLLGGAAGSFVTPERLDVPLTFEGTRAIGAALGSGVVMAFDDSVDLRAIVRRIARFFRDESCGQCVPCRVGTVRQDEALARYCGGADREREVSLIGEIGRVMRDASICGLGQTASSAIESALALGLL
jgi:NADH-quinone oxidoreductase subunit F